jgi:multiple sugar transport system ATP-binding protein
MDLYHRPANLFVAGFIGSPTMNFIAATLQRGDATSAEVRLDDGSLLNVAADASGLAAGTQLTLGVRPEHLLAVGSAGSNTLHGQVLAAEHLGDVTYLHLKVAGAANAFVARTDPENDLAIGDTATLVVPPGRGYLFGPDGRALPRLG